MLPFFDRFSAGACLLRSLKWRARAVAGSDFCHRESEINLPLGGASEDIAFVDGSSADGTEKRSFFCYETQFADEHPIRKKTVRRLLTDISQNKKSLSSATNHAPR